ncbi:MAG: acyl carrier protein [Clostridia bacterium]|nr:acyl carrier protein [Clostridia bacterium]
MTNEKILETLASIIADKIDTDAAEIKPETTFEELGIDSLDITDIAMSVEDAFGIEVEVSGELKSVGDLVNLVASLTA